jgi:hypothetical protein
MRDLPEEIVKKLRWWKRFVWMWRTGHVVMSFIGIASTISAATRPTFLTSPGLAVATWLAPLAFVLQIAFTPSRRAGAYNDAVRVLEPASIRYRNDPSLSILRLTQALENGERVLKTSDPY